MIRPGSPPLGAPHLNSIASARGNPTTISRWISGSSSLNTLLSYFDTGLAASSTDPNTTVTNYTYTCGGSYLAGTSIQGFNLPTSYTYDCNGGVITSTSDPNDAHTAASYSGQSFWRPTSTTDALSNTTSYSYYSSLSVVGQVESAMTFNGGNSISDMVVTPDSPGRVVLQQRRQAPLSSTFDTVETDYDSSGRVAKVTLPFASALGDFSLVGKEDLTPVAPPPAPL